MIADFRHADEVPPLVSVLVPSYRAGAFLPLLLRSVRAQTHEHLEVLVLDDGGGDLDQPGLAEFESDARFQFIRWSPNRGVSEATRFLMQQAGGEFWCNPGADDLLHPDFVKVRLRLMREHPELSVVFGRGGQIDEKGEQVWLQSTREAFDAWDRLDGVVLAGGQMLERLLQGSQINTTSVMARSAATLSHLLRSSYDWRFCQDWFYWLLLAGAGCRFAYDKTVLHDYRVHQDQLTRRDDLLSVRVVEPALVLLTGLRLAAEASEVAATAWQRYRIPLYALFLLRLARRRADPGFANWKAIGRQSWERGARGGFRGLLDRLALCGWLVRLAIEMLRLRKKGQVLHGLPGWVVAGSESR